VKLRSSGTSWQGHRITEQLRLKGTSGGHWSHPAAQRGPRGAGCPGPCPDYFSISPRMKTPQPLWEICARVQSPSQ